VAAESSRKSENIVDAWFALRLRVLSLGVVDFFPTIPPTFSGRLGLGSL